MVAQPPFPTVLYPRMNPPSHREKDMKVLVLGISRTGTMSLYVALKQLGYTPYHCAECSMDLKNGSLLHWNRAIDAKYHCKGPVYQGRDFDQMLWDMMYAHSQPGNRSSLFAITDVPCILFAEELMDAYPDAQIILTTRDVKTWLSSMERSFYTILNMKRWKVLEMIDTIWARPYLKLLRSFLQVWTNDRWEDRDRLVAGFEAHYTHVRLAAKARRRPVLEFRVQEGWGPLCKFLNKKQPDEAFPRVNEGDWIAQYHVIVFWFRLVKSLRGGLLRFNNLA
ncbi:NAD dependent epimerase/dehydratase [Aspergillus karnatakaensis]|uniref:sulfotransferase family protein n=1 Tax=Aspergillus karnatakaensis TaxID=1810916 RepID=UPI003CCCF38C